jgi:hypothetical protein
VEALAMRVPGCGVGVRNDEESQTAVLVCAGRAVAHGRSRVPAFSDPTAEVLLPADMQARVRAFFRAPAIRALLAEYGFAVVRDQDLVEIARALAADTAAMGPFPRAGRVAVAQRPG